MTIRVKKSCQKVDSNGKKYKFLTLFTPEYAEISSLTDQLVVRPSKTCGYVTYPIDYTDHQGSDPGATLTEGEEVDGFVVSVRVRPYFIGKDMLVRCSVPVFMTKEDPIEFEIALEEAVKRAGKIIDPRELMYGEGKRFSNGSTVPSNCLVVKTINKQQKILQNEF